MRGRRSEPGGWRPARGMSDDDQASFRTGPDRLAGSLRGVGVPGRKECALNETASRACLLWGLLHPLRLACVIRGRGLARAATPVDEPKALVYDRLAGADNNGMSRRPPRAGFPSAA